MTHDARDSRQIDAAVAEDWCWSAESEGEAIAGDGGCLTQGAAVRQGIREYELIWLSCSSACVQCLGLTGACAACSHCTATAWELSDLDHFHAATPQRVTRASCAQLLLLRSDFCAWRCLLLICWKLLIGVCVRDGLAASVCVYRTSVASVELLPRGRRAVAFPRWLPMLLARVVSAGLLFRCSCSRPCFIINWTVSPMPKPAPAHGNATEQKARLVAKSSRSRPCNQFRADGPRLAIKK